MVTKTRRQHAARRLQRLNRSFGITKPVPKPRSPGRILVGTASWTDPGFIADWYPKDIAARKRLAWYAEHFNLVEVNSTFYAIPSAKAVERWCSETPDDFCFDVKLPKLLSRHSM